MQNNKVNPSTLSGFMELMPSEQKVFNKIEKTLKEFMNYMDFIHQILILEKSEVLLAKAGGETEKQIYRFQRRYRYYNAF